jgi:hypothetical protein
MIPNVRLLSHQLISPALESPEELVSQMGMMQAQDYKMVKWAVGIRLKNKPLSAVEAALAEGKILRTHVLRPTWHLVAAEDIRWMCELSKKAIKASSYHRDRQLGIDEKLYSKVNNLLETILRDNNHLTRLEIAAKLNDRGIKTDVARMIHFMMRAEVEGIVCSGVDKGKKQTYALIDERVKPVKKLDREDSLVLLAGKYFRSHSPASLYDFAWWSGLSITDSKLAINLIKNDLELEKFSNPNLYVHRSLQKTPQLTENLHLLPSFDEYLISYKDRSTVLEVQHQSKAFSTNGIFFPVVVHNGKVTGSWKYNPNKNDFSITFFEKMKIDNYVIDSAEEKYKAFINA